MQYLLLTFSFNLSILGSSTSCWLSLNMEAMKRQFVSIQAKRMALGKNLHVEL